MVAHYCFPPFLQFICSLPRCTISRGRTASHIVHDQRSGSDRMFMSHFYLKLTWKLGHSCEPNWEEIRFFRTSQTFAVMSKGGGGSSKPSPQESGKFLSTVSAVFYRVSQHCCFVFLVRRTLKFLSKISFTFFAELYFLIIKFLAGGPCRATAEVIIVHVVLFLWSKLIQVTNNFACFLCRFWSERLNKMR